MILHSHTLVGNLNFVTTDSSSLDKQQLMKKLTQLQTIIMNFGGLAIVVGALMPIWGEPFLKVFPYVYAVGSLCFCTMQMLARYEGSNFIVRRLRRQQLLGALLLLIAAVLMFMSLYRFGPFQGAEWQMALALGTVFELYTSFRIPAALKKAGED